MTGWTSVQQVLGVHSLGVMRLQGHRRVHGRRALRGAGAVLSVGGGVLVSGPGPSAGRQAPSIKSNRARPATRIELRSKAWPFAEWGNPVGLAASPLHHSDQPLSSVVVVV